MIIEIPSKSELSNMTVTLGCPIEEDIQSIKVQQVEQEPELDLMVWPRKKVAPVTTLPPVPPPD